MNMKSTYGFDLYGVNARRGVLSARVRHPFFAGWWERFLGDCRSRIEEPAWPDAGPTLEERHARAQAAAVGMETLALAAALAGDDRLGRRAAEVLREVAADPDPWMGPGHKGHYPELNADLMLAERCKRVAATLSWADPWIGEGDRRLALSALAEHGGAVIFADAERGAWWADGHNSNWCAVLNSGLGFAALAARDTVPEADAWLARAKRAVTCVLDLAAEEGAGIEGMGYWCYCFTSSLDLAEALHHAGDDELMAHPFWSKASDFPLYFSLPDLSGWTNYGDCGFPGLGGSSLLYAVAARTGDRRAQWLANRIAWGGERLSRHDFLRCDPEMAEEGPEGLPACRLFSSAHLASFRSAWEPDAVFFSLKGGSNAWSHCHLDLNSFLISAFGERLAVDPGPWAYTKDYWTSVEPPVSTAWHNTITVDGGDQRQPPRYRMSIDLEEGGDAYCRLGEFFDTEWVAGVTGDATTAYADTLERFRRHVLYLKPDAFLILDDIRVRDVRTQRHLQWLLHSDRPMEETPEGLVVRGERAELHVRPLLPLRHASKFLEDRTLRGKGAGPVHCWSLRPEWHHIWNVSPSRSPYPHWDPRGGERLFATEYPFVTLLQVTRRGESTRWDAEAVERGSVHGARLRRGEEEVLALFDPDGAPCVVGDVQTDARQLALRLRGGRPAGWVARDVSRLAWGGVDLFTREHPAALAVGPAPRA